MERDELKKAVQQKVSKMLAEKRAEKGLSLYEIEKMTGIHHAAIWRVERGDISPRIDTLQRLCEVLELEITLPLPI